MLRVKFLVVLTCFGWAHSFVFPNAITTKTQTKRETVLNLDPSHIFETVSTVLADASDAVTPEAAADYIPGTSGDVSYSRASYYTILGLYLFSFPGLWSTVKRSTAAKMKKKTYVRYVIVPRAS